MVIKLFDKPEIEPLYRENKYILTEDFNFYIDGFSFWIPKGFIYDGASIPRIFWSIIGSPFEPDFMAGALIHDWLYLTHQTSRSQADEALFQCLALTDVSLWRRRCIWSAVRIGGFYAYKTKQDDIDQIVGLNAMLQFREDKDKFGYPLKG